MITNKTTLLSLVFIILSFYSLAQDSNIVSIREKAVKVFIDCDEYTCDLDYIKTEIPFVNYMRDTKEASLHVIVASEYTGSNGKKFTLFFIGQKEFFNKNDTVEFSTINDDTDDIIREKMVKYLKLGFINYVRITPVIDFVDIENYLPVEEKTEEIIKDKWKNWVFSLSSSSYSSGDENYKNLNFFSTISAQKVTPEFKTESYLSNSYSESKYNYDDLIFKSYSRSYSLSNMTVFSLSDHWSAGITASASSSIFSNNKLSILGYPAVEYDVFPYSQSTRKQIRIAYFIGPNQNYYNDTTIYNKMQELVFDHSLNVAMLFVQKWGKVSFSSSYSNYLHDFSLNNIYIYGSVSVRIVKGLELSLNSNYSIIHNQIALEKGDFTQEELFLKKKQLKTTYSYYYSIGLSYTFGNIYNNVVNPRFGG